MGEGAAQDGPLRSSNDPSRSVHNTTLPGAHGMCSLCRVYTTVYLLTYTHMQVCQIPWRTLGFTYSVICHIYLIVTQCISIVLGASTYTRSFYLCTKMFCLNLYEVLVELVSRVRDSVSQHQRACQVIAPKGGRGSAWVWEADMTTDRGMWCRDVTSSACR